MPNTITVFVATGLQGGSVIPPIQTDSQLSCEFSIRGVTRDPHKPAAKKLATAGVEVITVTSNPFPCDTD
jgi:hypothetical protein